MIALRDAERSTGRAPASAAADAPERAEENARYLCRACRTPITDPSAVFGPSGAPPVQVFTNPEGRVCQVLTVTRADNLLLVGPATADHSWFRGYAWRIALCGQCTAQLGWRYEAPVGSIPQIFYGLLLSELEEACD